MLSRVQQEGFQKRRIALRCVVVTRFTIAIVHLLKCVSANGVCFRSAYVCLLAEKMSLLVRVPRHVLPAVLCYDVFMNIEDILT